jgi:general secretion pathway protein D
VPPQVHISVLIAELTKDNTFDFAIELAAVDMPAQKGDTAMQGGSRLTDSQNGVMNAIQTGIFPKGLTFGLAYGSRVDDSGKIVTTYPGIVNLNALKTDARFQVLSETALEAQNNKDASVNIVNQIPILKSTIQGGSGTSRDVIQNIDRVDVGIKLKLTPHVIPGGDVRMDLNPSIEAVLGSTGDALTPTIARREVATTVTVPDGKTIVIAGLTRTDKTEIKRKVPILGSIPLLGWLFRNESEGSKKTDLLIFVTPHVLGGAVSSDRVREEWEKKTGLPPHEEPSK